MASVADIQPSAAAMTPEQITLVQDSFRLVLPIRTQAAGLFYARLFDIDPGTRALFTNTDLEAQGDKLMSALSFVVGALRKPDTMLVTVRGLALRHVGYGVVAPQYASVGAALLWTLRTGLGAAATSEVMAAWEAAYALLSGAMLQAITDAAPARAA